jgi:hypothetical protein
MRMKNLFGRRPCSAEIQQKLNVQRFKLEQLHFKIGERVQHSMQEAKECLARGDESGFRIASHGCILAKNAASSINDLKEMAMEMIDLVEIGEILHGVVEAGVDLAKLQGKLGLDPTKLESSLGKIRASMTHMDGIADALSATIEASISNPKQLSADQEILRKEILTEMQAQEIPAEKLKDKAIKELQPIQT